MPRETEHLLDTLETSGQRRFSFNTAFQCFPQLHIFAKLGFGHCQDKKQVLCKNQCSPASEGGGGESKV